MTRQTMLKWTAALAFGLVACGCTEPCKPDILLAVVGSISQPDLNLTLREAEALIDGQVVGREQSTQPQAVLLPAGQKLNVCEGAHTVGFRVVSQTASPTVYEISALVNADRPGGGDQNINLGPRTKTLATGDTVMFTITVNP